MNAAALGRRLAARRREAGLTQADLAERIGTTQSAISRIEAGRTLPSLEWLERFARATGEPFRVVVGETPGVSSREERRARVRGVLGSYQFNPWQRRPTEAEAKTLIADGLSRERFESKSAARTRSA